MTAMGPSSWTSVGFNGSRISCPCSSKDVQHSNRFLTAQRHDHAPNASQWGQHRSGARVQNFARSSKTRSMESFQQCRKRRQKQSSGALSLSRCKLETTARRAQATVDTATVSPSSHKWMTAKYMLDVFGGARFLARTTNHLGLRGCVLDTKFGPRYDVTKPLVLTRIRHNISVGKRVAG